MHQHHFMFVAARSHRYEMRVARRGARKHLAAVKLFRRGRKLAYAPVFLTRFRLRQLGPAPVIARHV